MIQDPTTSEIDGDLRVIATMEHVVTSYKNIHFAHFHESAAATL